MLCSRNLIKGINTWEVTHCKIYGTLLKMDKGVIKKNGQKVDGNGLYVSRKRKRLSSIEDCIEKSIEGPEDYI